MNKQLKNIWIIALVVQVTLGFLIGVYEATCGAYFYERFGSEINSGRAIMLATLLLVIRQCLMTIFEMPAGALADTIGRVQVIVISWLVRAAFFICLAALWFCKNVSSAFALGLVASVLWAVSYTLFNGAFSAWCADYLKEKVPGTTYAWLSTRYFNYYAIAFAAGIPVGIIFYLKELPALIYVILALLSFLCVGFCLLKMRENKSIQFIDRHRVAAASIFGKMRKRLMGSFVACRERPILFWIIMTYGSYMFLLSLVLFLWPVYLKESTGADKFSPQWIKLAVVMAILFVVSSRTLVIINNWWAKKKGKESYVKLFSWFYIVASLASSCGVFGLSYATATATDSFAHLAVALLVVVFSWGFIGPCFETLVNHYIGERAAKDRATIISAGSLVRSVLIVFLALPSAGFSGAKSPIYWAIPAALLMMSSAVFWVMVRRESRQVARATTQITNQEMSL